MRTLLAIVGDYMTTLHIVLFPARGRRHRPVIGLGVWPDICVRPTADDWPAASEAVNDHTQEGVAA